MRRAADAARRVVELPGIGFAEGDKVRESFDRRPGADADQRAALEDQSDRRKVCRSIRRWIVKQCRRNVPGDAATRV